MSAVKQFFDNLFNKTEKITVKGGSEFLPPRSIWFVWDIKEKAVVYRHIGNEAYPQKSFGGPWGDPEQCTFIKMKIFDTLERLGYPYPVDRY